MMNRVKTSMNALVASTFVIASLGFSVPALALKAQSKSVADGTIATWTTPDSNHQIIVYRVLDRNSSSLVYIHVDSWVKGQPGGSITLNGCSGENNLTLLPSETFECVVKYSAPLTLASINADEASGFVQFISKGPK